jgi:hypothetical protein
MIETLHSPATKMDTNLLLALVLRERGSQAGAFALRARPVFKEQY